MNESAEVTKRQASTPTVRPERTPLEQLLLGNIRKQLATVLGTQEKADAYVVEILNMARRTPGLHTCTAESLAYGIMRFASLRLNPAIPNQCWLIPRKGVAEPQYGYGGLRELVLRSGEVKDCFSREVCENDTFETPETPISLPVHRVKPFMLRGRVIGYYNVIQKHNGNWLTLMMSVAEVEAHRDRYAQKDQSGKHSSSWSKSQPDKEGLTNFDKMGLKTVLRMNCNPRNVTLSAEVHEAIQADMRPFVPPSLTHQQQAALPPAGTGVTIDLSTGEIREPVVIEKPEHQKRIEEHITDLFGKTASGSTPLERVRQADIGQQIDGLLTELHFGDVQREAFWKNAQATYPDLTPGALAILRDRLTESLRALHAQEAVAQQIESQEREPSRDDDGLVQENLWEREEREGK